ncbi:MAG: molybdopterin-binding protein [Chloroflexota bacterium]
MKFGAVPLEEAQGKILGHNIAGADGRRALRKGQPLSAEDLAKLARLGRDSVYVATPEVGDVAENEAAYRIACASAGANISVSKPTTGRSNLHAEQLGILRIDQERLMQVNMLDSVTLATVGVNSVVLPKQMVATLKIISYGIPENVVREAERIGHADTILNSQAEPLLRIDPLERKKVGMILSGSPSAEERIVKGFEKSLRNRLNAWGSDLDAVEFVPLEDEQGEKMLAAQINQLVDDGVDMIILAGETAIMDRHDIAPRAVERAGGRVTCFGAPVDPGNLLMLARHDETGRSVQIIGTPGCARSAKKNIVDLVIPRILVGDYLTKMDIVRMGVGGMLDDVKERGRARKLN